MTTIDRPLGKNWSTKFLQRHPQLPTERERTMDITGLIVLDPDIIEPFFTKLSELRTQHRVDVTPTPIIRASKKL